MIELHELTPIFRMVFDDDSIEINETTNSNDVDGWDSMSHINLILAIENNFSIHFSQKELLLMKNVRDLLNSINTKL